MSTEAPEKNLEEITPDTALEEAKAKAKFKPKDAVDPAALARLAARAWAKAKRKEKDANAKAAEENARRKKKHTFSNKPAKDELGLALRATVDNVHLTSDEVVAWYVIPPRSTAFTPISHVNRVIDEDALAYSKLEGRRCYLRSTTRPHSVYEWAEKT